MFKKEKSSSIILKITLFKHIRAVFMLLFTIGLIIIVSIMIHDGGINSHNVQRSLSENIIFFLLLAPLFAFFILFALFLHIDYFKRNRHEEYEIGNRKIIKRKNGEEWVYLISDIDNIHLNLNYFFPMHSFSNVNSAYSYMKLKLPWGGYHFAEIVMKSGEVLYLTSLLYPSGIEKVLEKYIKTSYREKDRWFTTTLYCPPD